MTVLAMMSVVAVASGSNGDDRGFLLLVTSTFRSFVTDFSRESTQSTLSEIGHDGGFTCSSAACLLLDLLGCFLLLVCGK